MLGTVNRISRILEFGTTLKLSLSDPTRKDNSLLPAVVPVLGGWLHFFEVVTS